MHNSGPIAVTAGPLGSLTIKYEHELAVSLARSGQFQAAYPILASIHKRNLRRLGEDHEVTLVCLQNLVDVLINLKRFEEALPLAELLVVRTPADSSVVSKREGFLETILVALDGSE